MQKRSIIVAGLGFGDEGKGTIVDHLVRQGRVSAVVRYSGGSQARHNVVTQDGRQHEFAQFGAGSFVPGVRTHLSRHMLVDPVELKLEADELAELGVHRPLSRLSIDRHALIIVPFYKAANRLRETLRSQKHGTTGFGVGETVMASLNFPADAVVAGDLLNWQAHAAKLVRIQERLREEFKDHLQDVSGLRRDEVEWLSDSSLPRKMAMNFQSFATDALDIVESSYLRVLARQGNLVFEGAQGALLDEWRGFHPHTTWSTTTFDNALALLREIEYEGVVERVGVMRTYHTRHGEGPIPTYDAAMSALFPDTHNGAEGWQGEFRLGHFDLVLARYALEMCGSDSLALTHLDRLAKMTHPKVCVAYKTADDQTIERLPLKKELTDLAHQEMLTRLLNTATPVYEDARQGDEFVSWLERNLNVPVSVTSWGPTAMHKRQRALASAA